MIAYFGEVVKMAANISYLMMTLNRYLLVGKGHAPWLVTVAKLEFKLVIRWSLLFSALVNIGHGWQYQAMKDFMVKVLIDQSFNENIVYLRSNGYSYSDYPEANQGQLYFIYSIVYFVINFGVFFVLNTAVEVKIVRRMHKELKEKRERMEKLNTSKASSISLALAEEVNTSKADEDKKKAEFEDTKKERKVINMVVLNGVINFIFRAPDILFWMENKSLISDIFNKGGPKYNTEFVTGILNLIADIGYLTYIITFTTNFVIFYNFNKNFKEAVVFFNCKKNKT
jgi:hypothetical protein